METTEHEFVILREGKLETYTQFEDIPATFDNVVKFKPYIFPGPHTPEQHAEAAMWNERLKELMRRETR